MVDSILESVKGLLGISATDNSFDTDIIIHINSAIMYLHQLGLDTAANFVVLDKNQLWSTLLENRTDLEGVKQYVFLRTRLTFDPPSSSVLASMEKLIGELEWRLILSLRKPLVPETTNP